MGSCVDPRRRSLAEARHRRVDANLRDYRLAGDRALAQQHLRRRAGGQIDVHPAAESDQADALAGVHHVAFADERENAPRDETGYLRKADAKAVAPLDEHMLALIVLARLVEVGVDEFAGNISDALH